MGYYMAMKTTQELFEILTNSENLDGCRAVLREYLLGQVQAFEADKSKGEMLAYDIAGLMSAQAVSNLPQGDPYGEVLSLAGDLELPLAHRDSSSTWDEFITLVNELPDQP